MLIFPTTRRFINAHSPILAPRQDAARTKRLLTFDRWDLDSRPTNRLIQSQARGSPQEGGGGVREGVPLGASAAWTRWETGDKRPTAHRRVDEDVVGMKTGDCPLDSGNEVKPRVKKAPPLQTTLEHSSAISRTFIEHMGSLCSFGAPLIFW